MNTVTLPKIELHCHLDGSVRPETIIDIAKNEGINIPSHNIEKIRTMMIAPLDCASLPEYLNRFDLPIKIMQSKESLRRISFELLEDAAKENTKYIEIRFAPLHHIRNGLSVEEVIESVLKGIKDAEMMCDIKGNLILSCMRNMAVNTAYDVIESGKKYLGKGVIAIDLCANEDEGFSQRFIEPIAYAKELGFRVTIHAGETGIGKNVLEAIKFLGAERIGHGVFIKDCVEAYDIVKSAGITLEMCPTSNVQTKAVNSFAEHPIYDFYRDGINITVNTDNRTVSDTTLSKEYDVLIEEFNITWEDYKKMYLNSVDASFVDSDTKDRLLKYIK